MSGFVAVFNLDGRLVDAQIAGRMLTAIAPRGPDASHVWTSGAVALGHCLLATTPESVDEYQPHEIAEAGLCMAFDGRLDNREELAEQFERERVMPAARSDAAFVMTAYRCWGTDCASRLLGDFAFAIWDAKRRQMFCARDVIGLKPFYYHHGPDTFLCASEPQALMAHPAVSRRVNEGMVGEYLSVVTSTTDTPFADVQRLAPAGRLIVSTDRCRVDTYWAIDTAKEIRYSRQAEYAEHLHEIVRDAVRVRLRSCTPVGVLLSGGVDSSSVLGLATALRRSGAVSTECNAWSLVGAGDVLDESPFIAQVVHKNGCRGRRFPGSQFPAEDYHRQARQRADVPCPPTGRLMQMLKQTAYAEGTRTLLSGLWGDEWFGGSYYHCTDLFRSGRWLALAREARVRSRVPELTVPHPLAKVLTWPLLSRTMRKRIKIMIGRDGVPAWVRPDFARRIALADRLYPDVPDPAFPTIAQREIYREVTGGVSVLGTEEDDRVMAEFGIEARHPFADRRVMEFGMAIPDQVRWRDGVKKAVLRDAMRDYLPDDVGARLTSAEASSVFLPPIRECIDSGLLQSSRIERHGWVDVSEVRRLDETITRRYRSGDLSYARDVWPLWSTLAVEIWMREAVETSGTVEE